MPETLPDSKSKGKITPSYGGIYSNRIVWDLDKLHQFAKESDLRTNITISEGSDNDHDSVEQLGDTLALKRTLDITDNPFGGTNQPSEITTKVDLQSGEAVMNIHHQRLAQRLRDQSNGILDYQLFRSEMSELVNCGLLEVLSREKQAQIRSSFRGNLDIIYGDYDVLGFGMLMTCALGLPGYIGVKSGLMELITSIQNPGGPDPFLDGAMIIVGGTLVAISGCMSILMRHELTRRGLKSRVKEDLKIKYPFMGKDVDLNPLTHLFRLQAGKAFLTYEGSNILK